MQVNKVIKTLIETDDGYQDAKFRYYLNNLKKEEIEVIDELLVRLCGFSITTILKRLENNPNQQEIRT